MSEAVRPGALAAPARLAVGLRVAVFARLLALQASWNHQRMQNLGLLVCLMPWLRARPRDPERDRLFCRRYFEFFNTNPYLAGYVVGGLLRLETEREDAGGLPRGQAQVFRDSLARAFASLGDQLFWLGLRPTVALAGCVLALTGQAWPVVGLGAAVAAGQVAWRWHALGRGYAAGYDIVGLLGDPRWHRAIAGAKRAVRVLAGLAAGWLLRHAWEGSAQVGAAPGAFVAVVVVALALPAVVRRRWAGEFLVLATGLLALLLAFALGPKGS